MPAKLAPAPCHLSSLRSLSSAALGRPTGAAGVAAGLQFQCGAESGRSRYQNAFAAGADCRRSATYRCGPKLIGRRDRRQPRRPATQRRHQVSGSGNGAGRGIRTPDPIITNDVLYQLSYAGVAQGSRSISGDPHPDNGGRVRCQDRLRIRMITSTPSSTVPSGSRGIALISTAPGSTSNSWPVSQL